MDNDKLLQLALDIWTHTETYRLQLGGDYKRSFDWGDTTHVISPNDKGMGGAIARLCDFLDAYPDEQLMHSETTPASPSLSDTAPIDYQGDNHYED